MGYPIYHSQYTAAQIEAAIGKGPRVNASGYWEVWNVSTMAYESTGVGAGVTPPTVVTQVSQMSNHGYIYIYNGSEEGYTAGYWYYWDGTAWTAGGAYEPAATDPTMTVSNAAASAVSVGAGFNSIENEFAQLTGCKALVFRSGQYVTPSATGVGETVSYSPSDAYVCAISPCTEGDVFYPNVRGYTGRTRAYFICDSNMVCVRRSNANELVNYSITIRSGEAYIVFTNRLTNMGSGYYAYKGPKPVYMEYGGAITSSTDMDDLRANGTYRWNQSSVPQHSPILLAGTLLVAGSSNCTQTVISQNGGVYVRAYYSNAWSDWVRVQTNLTGAMQAIIPQVDASYFAWNIGHTVSSTGVYGTNAKYAVTDLVPVYDNNVIINSTTDIGKDNYPTTVMIAEYTDGVFQSRTSIAAGGAYTIPAGINGIRVIYGYTSAGGSGAPDMTKGLLMTYFSVRFMRAATPLDYRSDSERPLYVAFGASTTIGAVHHYTGEDVTFSQYDYPRYVGKILGLRAYNLAVGSTGLVERDGADNNIMDRIYANGDLLSQAGLVTLMFAYGNDQTVGEPPTTLPIGTFTDYYPYDEEGYHPSGDAGLVTMINKGATLCGCLNWCIRYLNTHHPYAQVVVIFGSPSANANPRTISLVPQTEGVGVAPYTLDIGDYSEGSALRTIHAELDNLREALNVPIIDLYFDGNAFSSYSTYAKDPTDNAKYALFSTSGTADNPTFDTHPNDAGYKQFARFLAGKIISVFDH